MTTILADNLPITKEKILSERCRVEYYSIRVKKKRQ